MANMRFSPYMHMVGYLGMDFNIITKAFTLKMSFYGGIGQMVAEILFFYGMFSNNTVTYP